MTTTLFDNFERTDGSPGRYGEARFAFLNRVDQPFWARIRQELEGWYADYPDEQRQFDLRNRFRQPKRSQHFGAWWELYLHRLFRRLGFAAEVEPVVSGLTRDGESFLVEATTSFSGIVDERRQPTREAAVPAAVDTARNPNFVVRLEIEAIGVDQPRVDQIVKPLEAWLAELDPDDQVDAFDAPQKLVDVRGWKLRFTAFALRPEARGKPDHRLLGVPPGASGMVNDREQLVAALVDKGRKYEPKEPLVLAVLVMSDGTLDNEDIEWALLGPMTQQLLPDHSLGPPFRRFDGFWIRGNEPRGTRVSAVLIGNNIVPENVVRTWPRLWPNPWAARPRTVDLPFPRGVADQQGGFEYDEVAGTPHSILGLPEDWPGPDEPFSKPWTAQ